MKKTLIATVCAALISGCSVAKIENIERSVEKSAKDSLNAVVEQNDFLVKDAKKPSVQHVEKVWVPLEEVEKVSHKPFLSKKVVVNRAFEDIYEAASYITALTGIPVSVSNTKNHAEDNGQKPNMAIPIGPAPAGEPMGMQQQSTFPSIISMVSYSGPFSGLLDIIASKFDLFWEVDDDKNAIRFFRTKSQTFRLAALPGNASMSALVTGTADASVSNGGADSANAGGSGSSGVNGSENRSGFEFSGLSVWDNLEKSIKSMLTQEGKVVVAPSAGTITVDDIPPVLERVASFIKEQNAALARQVVLNVRVLAVSLNDSDSYGINWDVVYKFLGQGVNAKLSTFSGVAGDTGKLTVNIVKPTSHWDGTKAVFEAISKQAKVSQITSASLMTINNQPVPIRVGNRRSYLASITVTNIGGDSGGGGMGSRSEPAVAMTPGVITTGFVMSALPHILDDGRIMLQISGDISSLLRLDTVSSGQNSIQTPEIETRSFLQRVVVRSGETLILTGFEQNDLNGSRQGIGSPNNFLLGGSLSAKESKVTLVVLVQPILMKDS